MEEINSKVREDPSGRKGCEKMGLTMKVAKDYEKQSDVLGSCQATLA